MTPGEEAEIARLIMAAGPLEEARILVVALASVLARYPAGDREEIAENFKRQAIELARVACEDLGYVWRAP